MNTQDQTLDTLPYPLKSLAQNHNNKAYDLAAIAEGFIAANRYTFYSADLKSIVTYDDTIGIYKMISTSHFISLVQKFIRAEGYEISAAGKVDGAATFIRRMPEFRQLHKFNSDKYKFAVRNGIIDCSENGVYKYQEHTPEFYTTILLDVLYDKDAKAPTYIKTLREVLPDVDKQKFLMQWLAYCLLPTYEYQKILFQYGSGRNGKGIIWATLQAILGENYSSVSIHNLATREFMIGALKDKFVNFSNEQKIGTVQQDILKTLSGGDLITADRKFEPDPVKFYNKARLVISTNTLPEFSEINDSIVERYQILEFSEKFIGSRVDTGLKDKLITEKEKSGLLNFLLAIMPCIFKNGSVYFEAPESVKTDTRKGFKEISGLGDFIDDCLVIGSGKVLAKDIFIRYKSYCDESNLKPLSQPKFNKLLLETDNRITKDQGAGNKTTLYGVHLNM